MENGVKIVKINADVMEAKFATKLTVNVLVEGVSPHLQERAVRYRKGVN